MKTGIKVFFAMIILSLSVTAFAQQGMGGPRQTPEEAAKAITEWMKTELSLDKSMETKCYDIILKYAKKQNVEMQALRGTGDRDAIMAKRNEITAQRDKELKALLGEKKFADFKKKEEERRANMMQRRGGR